MMHWNGHCAGSGGWSAMLLVSLSLWALLGTALFVILRSSGIGGSSPRALSTVA